MSCCACGGDLQNVERQLRAADEATQTVTSCPRCPVKAWRIKTKEAPRPSARGFRFPIKRPGSKPQVLLKRTQRQRHEVVVVPAPGGHPHTTPLTRHVVVQKSTHHTPFVGSNFSPVRPTASVSGPRSGECSAPHSTRKLGLGITLVSYVVYDEVEVTNLDTRTLAGYYKHVSDVAGHRAMIYRTQGAETTDLVVDVGERLNTVMLREVIDAVYSTGGLPQSIAPYLSKDFVSNLETLSARAWDTSNAPESGYTFTCKPDGERAWLVFYGWCWYMVSKQRPHIVRKWLPSEEKLTNKQDTLVVDTEYVSGFGFLLIDCLTASDGTVAPTVRNMRWVLDNSNEIISAHPKCPLKVRQYFISFGGAEQYARSVPYPVDGVVAVRNNSTEILKVKDVKSVELQHKGGGVLCAGGGTEVVTTSAAVGAPLGAVVELRFSLDPDTQEYRLWDVFPRPDKENNPNSMEAVVNIFRSAHTTVTREDDERRTCLIWCNKLRETIYKRCVEANETRHIILDVGTGTGQSLSALSNSESVSYILLEPDPKRCRAIQRRLGSVQILTDPSLVVPMVRQLKSRSKKRVILNCSFSDLWSSASVLKKLAPELKCIQATFSLQFIVSDLYDLFNSYRVPVYGCCYTYDDVNEDGVLVDACGVSMRVTHSDTATVRWGSDRKYEEPAVTTSEMYGLGNVIRGSDVVEVPRGGEGSNCKLVCSKVSVLLPGGF